jgi:guanylate kinase
MIKVARRGVCLVLSAPSGAGKTAIADALVATEAMLERSISVTTRAGRPTEIEGVHYHFLTEDAFNPRCVMMLLEWGSGLQGTRAYGTLALRWKRRWLRVATELSMSA